MDVVWLKKDVRLHDHAPLSISFESGRQVLLLYVYEPSQLSHSTVHGSHVHFANEGLIDVDNQLRGLTGDRTRHCITTREGEVVDVLSELDRWRGVARLVAHQETGTYSSFERDRAVRKWCRSKKIPFIEPASNGVTRVLRNRDQFMSNYNKFITAAEPTIPSPASFRAHLVRDAHTVGILQPRQLASVAREHVADLLERQRGGERVALAVLQAFLTQRGAGYTSGISKPGLAWTSCSRLSPYLAHGHISIKRVTRELNARRDERPGGAWARSLAAFHSRLRWRAHFIQKLESEPRIEMRAMCAPLNDARMAEGDWDEAKYKAWCVGGTGFPMVDACMRCLIRHGWVNFRMRAMLVSFATYNLWLDWRAIASHLARLFLDYEPGIHYPQLQMQAGVTGINAMRVYSVTKQAKEHDPDGRFIRKYVPELGTVPTQFIHEPWKMPIMLQKACGVCVGDNERIEHKEGEVEKPIEKYPAPIVNEAVSARKAKEKMNSLRKQNNARKAAADVLEKHGSRLNHEKRTHVPDPKQRTVPTMINNCGAGSMKMAAGADGAGASQSAAKPSERASKSQGTVVFGRKRPRATDPSSRKIDQVPNIATKDGSSNVSQADGSSQTSTVLSADEVPAPSSKQRKITSMLIRNKNEAWSCHACTFINEKIHASTCEICRTSRK